MAIASGKRVRDRIKSQDLPLAAAAARGPCRLYPALQRFMAERADATIVEVPASHVSFVSQPEAATQLILQAVEATAKAR
jgi:hypothetical protein